jgi:type I restriction enzyme R subunit
MARVFLSDRGASLDDIQNLTGFARNAAIVKAKEGANESDDPPRVSPPSSPM